METSLTQPALRTLSRSLKLWLLVLLSEVSPSAQPAAQQAPVPCHSASSHVALTGHTSRELGLEGLWSLDPAGFSCSSVMTSLPHGCPHSPHANFAFADGPGQNLFLSKGKICIEWAKRPQAPLVLAWGAGIAQLLPEAG